MPRKIKHKHTSGFIMSLSASVIVLKIATRRRKKETSQLSYLQEIMHRSYDKCPISSRITVGSICMHRKYTIIRNLKDAR